MRLIYKWLFFSGLCFSLWGQDPDIIYLAWDKDPSSTMVILWHGIGEEAPQSVFLEKGGQWTEIPGKREKLTKSPISVYRANLEGLAPDTDYVFRFKHGELKRFRTLPNGLNRPLHVAMGGDAYLDKDLNEKMNRLVASKSPDFVIMGGDISYAEGIRHMLKSHAWHVERWEEFLRMWTRDMVTPEGRIIPLMSVIGNHDVVEGWSNPFKEPVLFYQLFPFPRYGIPYRVMDIGGELAFFLLDSGHSYPVGGGQAEWLGGALKAHQGALYKIPVYHIAAYPSVYSLRHAASNLIRKFWVPLFEKYGVKLSKENDNHDFKRTYPLWKGKIAEEGIVYIGDGAWGVPPREPKRRWYLAKAAKTNCFWMSTFTREKCVSIAYNNRGEVLDKVVTSPSGAAREDDLFVQSALE